MSEPAPNTNPSGFAVRNGRLADINTFMFRPGARVRHVVCHAEHDRWIGIVVGYEGPAERGDLDRIAVRWIRPDGDPSGDAQIHQWFELEGVKPDGG